MAAGNHQFGNEAPFAMAIVAAIGAILLKSKLESIVSNLHLVRLHAWVQWWPLLLIFAGAVLMLTERATKAQSPATTQSQLTDAQGDEK